MAYTNTFKYTVYSTTTIHGKSWTERDRTSAHGNIPRNHGNATSNQEKHRKLTKTKSQLKAKQYKSSQQNQPRNRSNTTKARGKILRTHGNATNNPEKTPKNHENTKITLNFNTATQLQLSAKPTKKSQQHKKSSRQNTENSSMWNNLSVSAAKWEKDTAGTNRF